MKLSSPLVEQIIRLAIAEDFSSGDITSELCIDQAVTGEGTIVAKGSLVVCGLPLIQHIVQCYGFSCTVRLRVREGDKVSTGTSLVQLTGKVRELLAAERVILNFLQHLSGIATQARQITAQVKKLIVLDTRKTTPGMRMLEKYAVRVGGAANHRTNLGDMILVKNNHVDACGSMTAALRKMVTSKPPYMPFEVEVRTLKELKEALPFLPNVIMLDNMDDADIRRAVAQVGGEEKPPLLEVSGGVTATRLKKLEELGVDAVSMSALTVGAPMVDIAMRIKRSQKKR